mmetsp:Transcript_12122/g.22542  ORF Transcript_12122/g.22542 Transcript_12122/m.22542 type:complete len:154 (+) Transcript_12122:174-635(+)
MMELLGNPLQKRAEALPWQQPEWMYCLQIDSSMQLAGSFQGQDIYVDSNGIRDDNIITHKNLLTPYTSLSSSSGEPSGFVESLLLTSPLVSDEDATPVDTEEDSLDEFLFSFRRKLRKQFATLLRAVPASTSCHLCSKVLDPCLFCRNLPFLS